MDLKEKLEIILSEERKYIDDKLFEKPKENIQALVLAIFVAMDKSFKVIADEISELKK